MKRIWIVAAVCSALLFSVPAMGQVSVGVGISLPPIVIGGPPEVVVLPDTDNVYVCPTIEVDLFFWSGWWWRPYGGGWYRSHYYDRDWVYFTGVPAFYFSVDPYWRTYYHNHSWHGYVWNYQRIPYSHVESNWKSWQKTKYWQNQKHWDVQGYSAKSQRQQQVQKQQRREIYESRPEVQQHQQMQRQQRQEMQRQPQMHEQRQPQMHEQRQPQMHEQRQPQQQQHGESRQPSHGREGQGEGHR